MLSLHPSIGYIQEPFNKDVGVKGIFIYFLEECERRDPKGLYKKARAGEIKGFTGIDDPYEEPENPGLVVETDKQKLEESVKQIITYLEENRYLE